MTYISLLLPAFIVSVMLVGGAASFMFGFVQLVNKRGWKNKLLGLTMILIPLTFLIASCSWASYNEEQEKQNQVQIGTNWYLQPK